MTRLCERPGCSAPAGVLYGVDMTGLLVWLEPLTGDVAYGKGVLCLRHAEAMVVPRGWSLDDRREPAPRLFRPAAPAAGTGDEPPARRARRRRPPAASEQLVLPTEGDATRPGGEPRPWMPVFDETDDLAGVLRPKTPMLARAFRSAPKREH